MAVIIWSFVVVAFSLLLAQTIRYLCRRILQEETFKLADEFLAAFQNSVCILELGVVSSLYGFRSLVAATSIFIFSVLKHFTFIRGKYVANPVCFIDSFYKAGKRCVHSPGFIIGIVGIQILAAILAHPFVKVIWGRTYSSFHNTIMFADCKATLQVPFIYGFLVEIFTTFVAWSTDFFTPMKLKPPVRSAVCLGLALLFEGTSGVWMNPAVATAHTMNCTGHDNAWEHIVTYWLGPFIAAICFYEIKEFVDNVVKNDREPHSKKTPPLYENGLNGALLMEQRSKIVDECNALQEKKSIDNVYNKYHRSPGGSLRPRKKQNIGPG